MIGQVAWVRIAVMAFGACLAACGSDDDEVVPIEQIPPEKPVTALSDAEQRGVCEWGRAIASAELPPPGTELQCGGLVITIQKPQCLFTTGDPARCNATVMDYQACFPLLMSRLGDDPCLILSLQVPGALEEFVNEIPGCEGVGPCTSTMP